MTAIAFNKIRKRMLGLASDLCLTARLVREIVVARYEGVGAARDLPSAEYRAGAKSP